jgi:23S rRNA (cytidine1920-2'-O)/16S rRNA (cytidine1409-2'-O)-methyltransferase
MKKEKILDLVVNKFGLDDKIAAGLILSGKILVNDKVVDKTGFLIDTDSVIRIKGQKKYVSRGAYKLLDAVESFLLDLKDSICMDIGSSTGGFTEVMLINGAKKVIAVDCGTNQLDFSLRKNPKVNLYENTMIQDLKKSDINEKIDFAAMDVSFASSVFLIDHIKNEFGIDEMVVLIKPQFEYRRLTDILGLDKNFNGIVVNDNDRNKITDHVLIELKEIGMNVIHFKQCKITGTKGNIEFLAHLTHQIK